MIILMRQQIGASMEMMEGKNIPFVLEQIDPLAHRNREVYAVYGLCMFLSQGLEQIMTILMAGCYFSHPKNMTRKMYDERLKNGFRRTFGMTVNEWCRHEPDIDFKRRLKNAVETRNWLAHRFFFDRAGHFTSPEGVEFMLAELTKISDEFGSIDQMFHQKTIELNQRLGITDSTLEEESERIKIEAITHMANQKLRAE